MAKNFIIEDADAPKVNSWKDEWKDMPEYSNKEIEPFKSVIMHFRNEEDYQKFCELIGQSLTDKTKSAWYPKLEGRTNPFLRYVDE